ncbi:hypothetical protein KW795_01130 [Candidatus Microgenomates bacterium]|nr:hypothetical protein [Candidatus Microgenomates bacterium]
METSTNKGQSLFEAVIAIAMVSIILIAIVSTAVISVKNSSFSRNKTLAAKIGQDTVEWLRGERDANWDLFSTTVSGVSNETVSSPVWCMPNLEWTQIGPCGDSDKIEGTIFKRQLDFETLSSKEIQATITISWDDSQGYHEIKLVTYFSDWRDNK